MIANFTNWRIGDILLCQFSRGLAICYIFTLVVFLSRRKTVKYLAYSIGFALFLLYIFLWRVFDMSIQPIIVTLVGETSMRESREFLDTFLLSGKGIGSILIVLTTLAFTVFAEKNWHKAKNHIHLPHPIKTTLGTILLFFVVAGLYNFKFYHSLIRSNSIDDVAIGDPFPYDAITSLAYSLHSIRTTNAEMKHAISVTLNTKDTPFTSEKDSLDIVYILGESYIKSHSGLYGYYLNTTPNLELEKKQGLLYVFNNVTSAFGATNLAMKNTFSVNSLAAKEHWADYPLFMYLFRKAGFDVYFWDNQISDTKSTYTFSVNSFLYNPAFRQNIYTQTNDKGFRYDDQLISDFASKAKSSNTVNLTIFHLWGQHVEAEQRYPHTKIFSRFTKDSIRNHASYMTEVKKQKVAEYDNATLYNDHVIEHIINLYRNRNTAIVYFSDHGEEVYDYRDNLGRRKPDPDKVEQWKKCIFDVPFMIWCSPKYQKLHPEIMRDIDKSLNKRFTTDNVAQVMFHLAGLHTSYYKADRDLISNSYMVQKRVLPFGVPYD